MRCTRFIAVYHAIALVFGLGIAGDAMGASYTAKPGELEAALAASSPGDVITVSPGVHRGHFVLEQSIQLIGAPGAVLDGGGEGRVLSVTAENVVVRGLNVRNSGIDLSVTDAGIFLDRTARGARVAGNRLENNLFGIYVHGTPDALVENNHIVGRSDLRMNERGNGIHLWNAAGTQVIGNTVRSGRDGIFVTTSKRNVFRGNDLRNLRFAVHYMYTNNSEISGNRSVDNHAGYALMYSNRLRVFDNSSTRDRDHGVLMNYVNRSVFGRNSVLGGATKCVFIYNSNKNEMHDNRFEQCGIGIHFTAGSEQNRMHGNAFVMNETQVKYVGTRWLDWSHEGRGNYWSDNTGLDLNADGIADTPYRPNDLVDQVVWRHPLAKFLLTSPAVEILRWAQTQFPSLHPGGVVDSAPLMRPPGTANEGARS